MPVSEKGKAAVDESSIFKADAVYEGLLSLITLISRYWYCTADETEPFLAVSRRANTFKCHVRFWPLKNRMWSFLTTASEFVYFYIRCLTI